MSQFTEMVVGFYFSPDGSRVALIRKARPEWQAGKYNGVGGKVRAGEETPQMAVRRKFREEAGVETAVGDWLHCVTLHFDGGCVHFFRCCPTSAPEEFVSEHDEPVRWYRRDILPLGCVGNVYWLVPLCAARDLRFPIDVYDVLPVEQWGKGVGA